MAKLNMWLGLLLMGSLVCLSLAGNARAQVQRSERMLFVSPRAGLSFYFGDWEKSLLSSRSFQVDGKFPYALGLEMGYQLNHRFSLSLNVLFADYPVITRFHTPLGRIETVDHPTKRRTVGLIARSLLNDGPVALYLQGGAHVTFGTVATLFRNGQTESGWHEENYIGGGPLFGMGVDVFINRQASLFVEGITHANVPDRAADADLSGRGIDFLSSLVMGLKLNFYQH